MKITPSIDGVPRATVRIDFRIDGGAMTLACLGLIDVARNAGEIADFELAPFLVGLTRADVIERLRGDLYDGGYQWVNWGWERVAPEVEETMRDAAEARVAELFPEFDRAGAR